MHNDSPPNIVFDAIQFAAQCHAGHYRKGTRIPYLIHPLGVAKILIEFGCPDEVAAAGILHDTVEDTPATLEEIERKFGSDIARLVESASEPNKSDTWENRKRHTVEHLKTAPQDVLMLTCADKLDNIRSIRGDLERQGDEVWDRFNRPREQQRWYYESLAGVFLQRVGGVPEGALFRAFDAEVRQVFGQASASL